MLTVTVLTGAGGEVAPNAAATRAPLPAARTRELPITTLMVFMLAMRQPVLERLYTSIARPLLVVHDLLDRPA